jgi:hypothetical protein
MTAFLSAGVHSASPASLFATFDVGEIKQDAAFFNVANWSVSGHSISSIEAIGLATAKLNLGEEMTTGASISINCNTAISDVLETPHDEVPILVTGQGVDPTLVSCVPLDESTIVLTYSEALAPASILPSRFTFTTPLEAVAPVIASISQSPSNVITIYLLNEMTEGALYTLHTATGITDLASNPLGALTSQVIGVGVLPQVASAVMKTDTTIILEFSVPMEVNAALVDKWNYALEAISSGAGAAFVNGVIRVDEKRVQLSVTPCKHGATYRVGVATSGPRSIAFDYIDPSAATANFTAIGSNPSIERIEAIGPHRVDVIFSRKMQRTAEIEDPSRYSLSPALEVLSASLDDSDQRTVHLVTGEWTSGTLYTLTIDVS